MGSINHPRLYDPAMMVTIKAAFHDVWKTITVHTPLRDPSHADDLKATVIRQLLDLVAEGTTSRNELKHKAAFERCARWAWSWLPIL